LGDLDRGQEQLDARTVLVVDEAGMVGSRNLARLLEHGQQAQAKVVLVGDDRQLAPIDAGGGFRALRLRLGASELTENRRQQQVWEREALDLVRSGLVDEAVAAYQAHDRVVAADSKPAATLALLQDWWAAYERVQCDPAEEVVVLAARRAEVDRLNTACQELLAARGRLGQERLQVEDRHLAVGDRVVCGKNAIGDLGVANGSRGTITALDPQARSLTLRLDGSDGQEITLRGWYLDGRSRGERNRRVDLAYATTGHRAQGLTRGRALVRLTGTEDVNWLYVQLSRARQDTRLYAVVGPEPQGGGELDLPDREQPDGYLQLAQALARAGSQRLAIDTPSSPDLQRLSTTELRTERDRLRRQLDQRPPATAPASSNGPPPTARRLSRSWPPTSRPPVARRPACLAGCVAATSSPPGCRVGWQWLPSRPTGPTTASGSCASTNSAATAGWRRTRISARSTGRWCGPWPGSGGPPAWRSRPTDPDQALGPDPHDPTQRADRQRARSALERVHAKQRAADSPHERQPTSERPSQPRPHQQRGRRGPERAAG
jgi:hypothetical protein